MSGGQLQVGAKWTAGALLVLAGAVLAPGCHDDSPSMKAVGKASSTINSVAGGAEAAVAGEVQDKAFRDAIKQLGDAKLDPSNPMASSMGVLTAASQLGAAGGPTAAAQTSMDRLSILAGEVRSSVSQWTTFNAVAAATTYDAAPKLAELDKQLTVAKGEMAQAKDRLNKLQADQDKMHASARDKADQALKFEQDSVRLKEDARKLKAAEAQPVLARALEAKGKCDELRLAVARTEADATVLEPRKLEVKQKLDELEIGIRSLESERERIARRGEDSAAAEKAARTKAEEVAKAIDKVVKELVEEREKNLVTSLDAVIRGCRDAQNAGGRGEGASGGKILSARAKQRLGEVLLLKAAEANEHAALMKELAEIKPTLPGAAGYAEASKAAAEAAAASRAEAKSAIEGARSDYKGLRVKGDANEAARLAVIKYLTKIGGLEPDESEAAPAPAGEGAEKKADGAEAASGADAEVKAFLADLQKSAADASADASKFIYIEGAAEADLKAISSMGAGQVKLDAACKKKFGKTLTEALKDSPMGAAMGGMPTAPGAIDPEHATIAVTGDAAVVTPEGGQPVKLKKVDGAWKLDLSDSLGKPEALAQMSKMGEGMAKVYDEVTADVDADKFEKIEDVLQALMTKAASSLMPKGGGEKGGG